jgi:hypothetical protein
MTSGGMYFMASSGREGGRERYAIEPALLLSLFASSSAHALQVIFAKQREGKERRRKVLRIDRIKATTPNTRI